MILTSSYDKFEGATFSDIKFSDTVAPKLVDAVATDATTLELTFDEPVDWTNGGVSVNGTAATPVVATNEAGNYTYTFTTTLNTGSNTVQVINAADFAGNNEGLTTTTVNYTADTSVAEVKSVEAVGTNTFLVALNKPVSTTGSTLTVKKGNYTFASSEVAVDYADADGVALTGTPTESKYLLVTVTTANGSANPLYSTSETSVSLNVALSGYKAGSVLGKEYTGSVTLTKDLVAPKVVSSKLVTVDKSAKTITVPFDKTISLVDATTAANNVTVMNGSVKAPVTSVSASGKNLVITLTDAIEDATYSVVLNKGLVKDTNGNVNAAESFTKEVTTAVSTLVTPGTIFGTASTNIKGKNVISVNYGAKVSDEAALASSYTLNGFALPTGTVVYFDDASKQTVTIELPETYTVALEDLSAKISLKANTVKDYTSGKVLSSDANTAKSIDQVIKLKDNVAPTVSKVEYVKNDAGLATGLKVTFSEKIKDSSVDATSFVIKQGSTAVDYTVATGTADDNVITLEFTGSTLLSPSGVVLSTSTATGAKVVTDFNGNNTLAPISGISAQ